MRFISNFFMIFLMFTSICYAGAPAKNDEKSPTVKLSKMVIQGVLKSSIQTLKKTLMSEAQMFEMYKQFLPPANDEDDKRDEIIRKRVKKEFAKAVASNLSVMKQLKDVAGLHKFKLSELKHVESRVKYRIGKTLVDDLLIKEPRGEKIDLYVIFETPKGDKITLNLDDCVLFEKNRYSIDGLRFIEYKKKKSAEPSS